MVKLFLIQHGEATTKDEDPAKPLTEQGAAVVEKMATWAASAGVTVSEIRHSGKRRAEQTAEILGRHLAPDRGVASRLVAGDPAVGAVRFTNAGIICLGREAGSLPQVQ